MARRHVALIVVGITALAAVGLAAPGSAAVAPTVVVQPQVAAPSSTLAEIKTITANVYVPVGVAVDSGDDTVYVANFYDNNMLVINGITGTEDFLMTASMYQAYAVAVNEADDTVYVANDNDNKVREINGRTRAVRTLSLTPGSTPDAVAVNQEDDTVYVANFGSGTVSVINGRSFTRVGSDVTVGTQPFGIAVHETDDSIFVANYGSSNVSVISGRTNHVGQTILLSDSGACGVAVNQDDDTVYVTNYLSNTVSIVNGRTGTELSTVPVGSGPCGLAVDQLDDTVYVANGDDSTISVISGGTEAVDDTLTLGTWPTNIAIDNSGLNRGLVYVTNQWSDSLSIVGRVAPSLSAASGAAGDAVTLTVDAPQVSYAIDDSTVASVEFGTGNPAVIAPATDDTWTVTVPAGSGTVPVTVTFRGGLKATAGNFTYPGAPSPSPAPPPPPAPTYPPGPPTDVTALGGDAAATLSWAAPISPGSFPVTNYQVTSSPGGQTCLTATLTCTVTGLTNGTTYTFTVKALSAAGWGASSTPSNAVTPTAPPPPSPSIVITGTRDSQRITVTGTAMHLVSQTARPWMKFPGQTSYTAGSTAIPVNTDGTFTWSRKTNKKTYVYVAHGTTRSNMVTIPAR